MGIFSFGKSKKENDLKANTVTPLHKNTTIYQVVGCRNLFLERHGICLVNKNNREVYNITWNDLTAYNFKPVETVRSEIIEDVKGLEQELNDLVLEEGKIATLNDGEIFFHVFMKNKNITKISLEKFLKDYEAIVKLSREKKISMEEIEGDLCDQYGYDVAEHFNWRNKLIKIS